MLRTECEDLVPKHSNQDQISITAEQYLANFQSLDNSPKIKEQNLQIRYISVEQDLIYLIFELVTVAFRIDKKFELRKKCHAYSYEP